MVKQEPSDTVDNEKKPQIRQFEFLHPVAMFHATAQVQKNNRSKLMRNIGPFRRALCARKDLNIRRQLCKVERVGAEF